MFGDIKLWDKAYNLGEDIVNKFTKLSTISSVFHRRFFIADFSQCSGASVEICLLVRQLGTPLYFQAFQGFSCVILFF